jgi:hypothetical protein
MWRIIIIAILSNFIFNPLKAQKTLSAKKHVKIGTDLVANMKYTEAATHFEAAWSLKPKKLEWLHNAAQLYLRSRDYRKAAEGFGTLKDNKFFPQARLNYALSLQQSGQYDEAIPEFLLYMNAYNGPDQEAIKEKIEHYINGCSAAIRQSDSATIKKLEIEHLSEAINTPFDDFAPIPFGDDILYFTNTKEDKAHIMRSQQLNQEWSVGQDVKLPIAADKAFGNGTFSPDGQRFYFTQKEIIQVKKEKKENYALYLLKRNDKGWAEPLRLNINTEGAISTQPFVFLKNDREYLFFVSNRKGSVGGMDIWLTSRSLKKDEFDTPKNLSPLINTEGDEMTPYYDLAEGVLYFSSNGRATFGGLDIFKSKGSDTKWEAPENIGAPFNSGADDWYYIKNKSYTGGFFVSNRSFGMEKITSHDDDIYAFRINERQELAISGKVLEKESKKSIDNSRVSLYEKRNSQDDNKLLTSVMSIDGQFHFALLPQKTYHIEVEKDGYQIVYFNFNTKDSLKNINKEFFLDKYAVLVNNKVEKNKKEPAKNDHYSPKEEGKNVNTNPVSTTSEPIYTYTEGVDTKANKPTVTPKKTKSVSNISYKIQILAYETLDNANRRRLSRVDDLGDLDTEKTIVNGRSLTRVLIADFDTYERAASTLKKVKDRSLTDAFIVRYENGKRTSKSR